VPAVALDALPPTAVVPAPPPPPPEKLPAVVPSAPAPPARIVVPTQPVEDELPPEPLPVMVGAPPFPPVATTPLMSLVPHHDVFPLFCKAVLEAVEVLTSATVRLYTLPGTTVMTFSA
jgi:hypothetical protein